MTIEKWMKKPPVVILGAMFCGLLWGSAFPCVKTGYQLFHIAASDTGTQILFAGCRFTLAGILVIIFGSLLQRRLLIPKRGSGLMVLRLSFMQTAGQYMLFYIGLAHTTGVTASIIEAVNVFIAILVASLIFKQEKLTPAKIIGCVIGFAGVAVINLGQGGMDMHMHLNGEGLIALSTVSSAFAAVFMKRYGQKEDPVTLSGYQFFAGGIVLAAFGLLCGGRLAMPGGEGVWMLLYLAFISAAAFTVWGILLKYNPVSKVAVFGFVNPVVGVILSAIFLPGEASLAKGWGSAAALILVSLGIYIVNRKQEGTAEKIVKQTPQSAAE